MTQESGSASGVKRRTACAVCGDEFEGDQTTCPFDGTKLTVIAQELSPGTVLGGRFEVLSSVAGGGMGTVYKATHKLMKRSVAIKTLHPSLVASGAALKRFQQESQALSALNHPNILSVYDFFINDEGQPYLVMDYLEGTNLDTIREKDGPMPWKRAAAIFSQACSGLAHAHNNGIVHRDIKPSNIMLVKNDKKKDLVKIVDFGIAKVRTDEESTANLTSTGDVFGSPQYMSPEQCRGLILDTRSDVYSLGCVMYATLTGKPAFAGMDNMECMYKQVHEQLAPFNPELAVPAELEAIVRKCMEKDPAERFQSMDELQAEIDKLISVNTTGPRPAAVVPAAKPAQSPQSAKEDMGFAIPADRVPLFIASALAVGVISVVAIAFLTGSPASRRPSDAFSPTPAPAVSAPMVVAPANDTALAPTPTAAPAPAVASTEPRPGETAQPAPAMSAQEVYLKYMADGQKAFNEKDFQDARAFFSKAHNAAWGFGQTDERFLNAMEWQAKTAKQLGQYAEAKQANDYIAAIRKQMKRRR